MPEHDASGASHPLDAHLIEQMNSECDFYPHFSSRDFLFHFQPALFLIPFSFWRLLENEKVFSFLFLSRFICFESLRRESGFSCFFLR